MKLKPMRYKNYVWPVNPETLRVEYARNLREVKLPLSGSILQDLGPGARVVAGGGHFTGGGCLQEFVRLEALFVQGGSGALQLPGVQAFPAAFASLKMTGEARPDSVAYEFVFLEDGGSDAADSGTDSGGVYVCAGGETLWEVANRYGATVDRLRALNPIIQWPNALRTGLKVVLP